MRSARKPDIRSGTRTLNILHVSTASSWRGGEQQLAYLVGELEQQEYITQTVVCAKGSALEQHCNRMSIPHVALKKRSSVDWGFAFQLSRLCRSLNISIMHCHDAHAHSFAVWSATLFRNPVPIVISRRVDFRIRRGFFSSFKYNHKSICGILCVSEKIRSIISPRIKDKTKLFTVYSGIDLTRFDTKPVQNKLRQQFNIPDDEFMIANVAALAPHKDYFTFIDTVEVLQSRDIKAHYFIIGEGKLRENIQEYIEHKALEHVITLTGFREDIPLILPGIDVFLITSSTEGLGTSILDAFACDVPVVATRAGGIPEIVIDNQTGLSAPVGDAEALAEQVIRMLQEPGLRQSMVGAARKHLQNFSREATAKRTLEVYRKICWPDGLHDQTTEAN
ncbi:MAG: glycosyltransferase [Flavobacteriales bacterium]|nr:glycosyltransferase [Flavobacteriales bacterium]